MRDVKVLDTQETYEFNDYLEEDENILWSDKPQTGLVITLLESKETVFIMAFFFVLLISQLSVLGPIVVVAFIVLCLIVLVRPQILFSLYKRKTRYALTNKRLFFKLWTLTGTKVHWLKLDKIKQIPIEEFKDKRGVLYFVVNNTSDFYQRRWYSKERDKPKFVTRNIESRELRHNPTFEFIPFAKEVRTAILEQQQLIQKGKEKEVKALIHKPKIPASEGKLKSKFHQLLEESNEIEWAGKPKVPISFLENPARTPISLLMNMVGLLGIIASMFVLYNTGVNLLIPALIFQFVVFFGPDPYRRLKASKTLYALEGSTLFFKIWHMGRTKIQSIDIGDIEQIALDERKGGKGTLFFQLKDESDYFLEGKKKKFETLDLEYGTKQQFPTFELVPDAKELRAAILERKKELVLLENSN